jgi:hypothetical protein
MTRDVGACPQVRGAHGYLFPKNFKVPPAYLGLEHGGIMNFTQPLSSSMPVFAAQLAVTHEYLQKMGVVPPTATVEQSDAHEARDPQRCPALPTHTAG